MIYLLLFVTFFKIGLFSFGGGYVMVPLILQEISRHGWCSAYEFADIVSISQMTPGPIAVNAATYVGYLAAGVPGALSATLGVSLPSFILVIVVARFVVQFKDHYLVQGLLRGIRPVVIGLMAAAVVIFFRMSVLKDNSGETARGLLHDICISEKIYFSPGGMIIAVVTFLVGYNGKVNPIWSVLLAAMLGIILL